MNFVTERCVRILYAGETGNAEEVAYDIQSQLPYQAVVSSLEEYDVLELPAESAVIFVVSTTGDGDTPGAMKTFWSFLLKKSLSNVALQQIMYGVFGLGDSSYEKYNAVARKLDRRLQMLGGKELVALGLGDDQAEFGYLSALNYWLSILIKNLAECGCTPPLPLKSSITTHVYKVSNVNIINITTSAGTISGHNGAQSKVYTTTVACNERLTASVWGQDVRHIRLHFPVQRDVSLYEVGDVAVVHYLNLPELVARATALISEGSLRHDGVQLSADTLLDIKHISQSSQSKRPSRIGSIDNVTLHSLLQRHLDIGAVPKRSYFAALAQYATNPEEADKLRELASPEGTDLYFDYCIRERMCYIEVLEEFRSCRPPLSALLELIQIIPPRQYSIASSPAMLPNEIELCVAVSQRRTPYGRKRTGLCSGYLARLAVNDSVRVSIKPGTIRGTSFCQPAADMLILAPASAPAPTQAIPAGAVPVIMVGPGTGVAPMRALIQHEICRQKVFAKSAVPSSSESGACTSAEAPLQAWLFFGCRKSQRDYLYGFDWTAINNNTNPYTDPYRSIARSGADYGGVGVIPQQQDGGGKGDESISSIRAGSIRVCTAFSQDQLVKQYVGHKIITNGALICSLLLKGACVFVAGSAKRMPADVRKAFATVLQQHADMTEAESEQFLTRMGRKQKYVVEAW